MAAAKDDRSDKGTAVTALEWIAFVGAGTRPEWPFGLITPFVARLASAIVASR